jgi:hypothetical protein
MVIDVLLECRTLKLLLERNPACSSIIARMVAKIFRIGDESFLAICVLC